MFDVWHAIRPGVEELKTVYAVDRATGSFLVTDWWGLFNWIPMVECRLYIPEDKE